MILDGASDPYQNRAVAEQEKTQERDYVRQIAESTEKIIIALKERDRWLSIHSFVAYLIFCLIIGGAAYFLYQQRVSGHDRQVGDLVAKNRLLTQQLADRDAEMNRRVSGEAVAQDLWRLYQSGKTDEFLSAYEARQGYRTPVEDAALAHAVKSLHVGEAKDRYAKGLVALRKFQHEEAAAHFQAAADGPSPTSQTYYYLGLARLRAKQYKEASAALEKAITAGIERAGPKSAHFYYGEALSGAGDSQQAIAAYTTFIRKHPRNKLASHARKRLAALRKRK